MEDKLKGCNKARVRVPAKEDGGNSAKQYFNRKGWRMF